MGKKGSWFSAIKRVFSHSFKDKVVAGTEKRSLKEKKKKKGLGKLKHGDVHSFIPLFREPSSIEKILGEVEKEHHITDYKPLTPLEHPKAPPQVTPPPPLFPLRTATVKDGPSPRASSSLRPYSTPAGVAYPPPPHVASPPYVTPVNIATPAKTSSRFVQRCRPEPTLREQHICATKIQAAYRGYTARRNYKALRGLVRLQGVVKSQSVKRQTANALKCMQLMVRVQNQIHTRRIQTLENQAQHRQPLNKNDKDVEATFGRRNLSDNTDEWEDSRLTKEEIDTRIQRKVDAIIKREKAMAYAYSHQLWKSTSGMPQAALMEIRSGGFPSWWNWQDQCQAPPVRLTNPSSHSLAIKTPHHFTPTSTRPTPSSKASPLPFSNNLRQPGLEFENMDAVTLLSTKPNVPSRAKLARTPPGRLQQKFTRGSTANSPFSGAATFKDDDSLMSCPPFSVPHYMVPTVSAQAKVRAGKERVPDSPSSTVDESKRRVSFPFGQAIGSFKWKNKDIGSQKGSKGKNELVQPLADHLSVASTVCMPATVGKKPFNRFV